MFSLDPLVSSVGDIRVQPGTGHLAAEAVWRNCCVAGGTVWRAVTGDLECVRGTCGQFQVIDIQIQIIEISIRT